jgi:predicted kinase
MVLASYKQATGDPAPDELIAFYSSYRACVRAKVMALRAQQQSDPSQRALNHRGAQQYLESAAQYAQGLGGPWLVVVRGLTGTGKSTLARRLAQAWDAALIQTDVVREERFGRSTRPVDYDQGAYQARHREEVYQEMFRRAEPLLAGGRTVLLDGTFLTRRLRAEARKLAEKLGARSVIVQAVCPPEVALGRIEGRHGSTYQSSADVYHRQREEEESESPDALHIRVDTTQSLDSMVGQVCRQLA